MPNLPWTDHAVWYAYQIRVNGNVVGSLQSFSPSSTQEVERVRELFDSAGGRVREMVPGVTNTRIRVERFQLYREPLLIALGYDIYSLENFKHMFEVHEREYHPDGEVVRRVYRNCMLASYGRTVTQGSIYVAESADIEVGNITGGIEKGFWGF